MAPTLDDILSLPQNPQAQHLAAIGLLVPPPPPPPTPAPVTVGPVSAPAMPEHEAAPKMTAPIHTEPTQQSSFSGTLTPPTMPEVTPPSILSAPRGSLESFKSREAEPHNVDLSAPVGEGIQTLSPLSSAYHAQQVARIEDEKANPWGSPENHPGVIGKILHGLAKAGNIAGNIVEPGIMANIPGTALNRAGQEATQQKLGEEAQTRETAQKTAESEAGLRQAQAQHLGAETEQLKGANKQDLVQDAQGNVTGWKDKAGALHALNAPETPQAIRDIAADTQNKMLPKFEQTPNGDIVALKTDKNGQTTSEVVHKGDPKIETDLVHGHEINGVPHTLLVNKKTGETIKDLGAETKPPSLAGELAQQTAGEKLVIATDKNGEQHLMTRAQAENDPRFEKNRIAVASEKDRADGQQNTAALNDMGAKVKNLIDSSKALDQNTLQRGIVATVLTHGPDSLVSAAALAGATELTKKYIQDVASLREAALALPKQTTGGSRVSEPQAHALWNTVPGVGGDSKYAEEQLRKFDENLARLWKKVPQMEGQDRERPFGETSGGAFKVPEGAPDATHIADGKVLKDGSGNIVARAKGGQWQAP